MKCLAVILLAVLTVALADTDSTESNDPNAVVNCYPCIDPGFPICRPLDINQCNSLRIKKCGCCTACVVYLNYGDPCRPIEETNAECGPNLYCNGGSCHYLHHLPHSRN